MTVDFQNLGIYSVNILYRISDCLETTIFSSKNTDTNRVNNLSSMFYGCQVVELDVSWLNTDNVTDMSYMFSDCYELEKINLSGLSTRNVKYMNGMFNACYELEKIDLSGFDTRNIRSIKLMFNGCEKLKELDLSNFDTHLVYDFKHMFRGCTCLEKLDISSFILSKDILQVRNNSLHFATAGMFADCGNLKEITLPKEQSARCYIMKQLNKDGIHCKMI